MQIVPKTLRLCALLAALGWTAAAFAQAAAPGRLQEGPFTHHFDGNQNESVRRPAAPDSFRAARLIGRCVATANIFSGRPDPSWTLSIGRSRRVWHGLQSGASSEAKPASRFTGRLGYRGILLHCRTMPETSPVLVRCGQALVPDGRSSLLRTSALDRDILLEGAGRSRSAFLRAYERTCGPSGDNGR